jgi:amidase
MSAELCYLELTELAHRLRDRKLSPVEVARAVLARVEALDGRLHSYARVTPEVALDQARQAEAEIGQGKWRGPLHGVPIAVKDLCYTKGIPTAAGMAIHTDFRPDFDATVVARLRQAGAVLLGKLQMTEGAFARHHPSVVAPINPWAADRWTGVSSSGSGVATAAGLCFASLGSDTLGSIRFPSASCAVTGLKPTWGRVSRHGIFSLAETLDHIGPMTRSAADAAAMLQVIAGADADDPTALHAPVPNYGSELANGVAGLRIGIDPQANANGVDPGVARALEAAARVLGGLGAALHEVRLPPLDAVLAGAWTLNLIECAHAHRATYPSRKADYGPMLAGALEAGHRVTAIDAAEAMHARESFRGGLAAVFETVDLLLLPALSGPPPRLDEMTAVMPTSPSTRIRFTAPFNMTGSPTITLPGGFTADGVPLAIQLIARHLDEGLLLRVGAAFQDATDWHRRRPPLG